MNRPRGVRFSDFFSNLIEPGGTVGFTGECTNSEVAIKATS